MSYTYYQIQLLPRWAWKILEACGGMINDETKFVIHDKCPYGDHPYHETASWASDASL